MILTGGSFRTAITAAASPPSASGRPEYTSSSPPVPEAATVGRRASTVCPDAMEVPCALGVDSAIEKVRLQSADHRGPRHDAARMSGYLFYCAKLPYLELYGTSQNITPEGQRARGRRGGG